MSTPKRVGAYVVCGFICAFAYGSKKPAWKKMREQQSRGNLAFLETRVSGWIDLL